MFLGVKKTTEKNQCPICFEKSIIWFNQYSPHGFCLYVIVEGELYSNMSLYEIFILYKCIYLMMFNQRQDNLYVTNLELN